jgi:fructose-6-phosphate aldolase 2
MEFFLDTVNVEKVKKYNEIYNITGVTSNPTILSRENCELFPTLLKIREIIGDKQLHVQVTGKTCEEMLKEAQAIVDRIDKNVYIKVPTNEEGIKTIKTLKKNGYNVTATIVYTLQQAVMAASVGADYVAPYFNRMSENNYNALDEIADMAKVFEMYNKPTKLLVASFRNTNQIMKVMLSGATAITAAPEFYSMMFENPSVDSIIERFDADWAKLYGEKRIYEI